MGAGAGYSIKSTTIINSIQSLKLDNIVEAYTVDDGLVNFIAVFDCNIDCTVDDLEFESYNAGGKIEDIVQGTMTKIRLQFENAEIDSESQSDIAEWIERNQYKIRENLRNTRIGTDYLVGAGWIHQTFTGAITDLDDLDAIEHEYYYANDWSLFIEAAKIVVESNVAEYIDKAVTGETVTTIFYVEDEDFTELEAAKEYAIDNGYDKVMAYVDEEDFEGNFNTIDSYVAWRDEPVEDEFDDSLDEGIADMAMNAVQGFASKAADAASRFAGKVSDTINRVKAGNTRFQRAAGAWQGGLDKIGNKLAQTAYDKYYKPGFDQVDDYNNKTIPNIDGNKTQHTAKNVWKNWKPVDEYQADQKKKAEADKASGTNTNADASTGGTAGTNNTGTNTNTKTNTNSTNQNAGAGSNTGSNNTGNKTGSTPKKTDKNYKYFSADDDKDTAKKKFRQFAMQYHPDREGGDAEKFKEMSNEYDHLFDSYDFRRFRESVERSIKRAKARTLREAVDTKIYVVFNYPPIKRSNGNYNLDDFYLLTVTGSKSEAINSFKEEAIYMAEHIAEFDNTLVCCYIDPSDYDCDAKEFFEAEGEGGTDLHWEYTDVCYALSSIANYVKPLHELSVTDVITNIYEEYIDAHKDSLGFEYDDLYVNYDYINQDAIDILNEDSNFKEFLINKVFAITNINESVEKHTSKHIKEATTDEFKEIMSLAKQAGFKTAGELFKFKKEHEGEDLIKALRDRVGSNEPEAEAFKVNYKDGNIYASKIIKASSKEAAKKIAEANGIKNIVDVKSMDYAAAEKLGFDYIVESVDTEQKEKWVQVRLKGVDKEGYNYSGNGGRSWVTKDSTKVDTWPSKDDAIANGNKTFKKSFKYGTHWDVVKLDSDAVNEAKEEKEPIKEDSTNGSVYGALYDTIQDAYDPVTYDEAEYAIETAYEDGDIDEEEYNELMQELDEARNDADKFNNEQLDELGKKFGLDYMFYKDRGEDVMLYAPDREDYEDEDAYEEKLEAFDDFLHYIEIDLDGDTEYFSETVTILHRW